MLSKLTPKREERIIKCLRDGNFRTVACRVGGINRATFYDWLKGSQEEHKAFRAKVLHAEAEAEEEAVGEIKQAARDGTWQAAAWWLERKYPERYRQKRDFIHTMEPVVKRVIMEGRDRVTMPTDKERTNEWNGLNGEADDEA